MFSTDDKAQMRERGSSEAVVTEQIRNFEQGFPFVQLIRPATVGDGLLRLNDAQLTHYVALHEQTLPSKEVVKFVPASGAASRMFKDLFSFMEKAAKGVPNEIPAFIVQFFGRLTDFAFYDDLKAAAKKEGFELADPVAPADYGRVLTYLLTEKGLNYGNLPKGLLAFHRYADGVRTPVEEHMVEGAVYGKDAQQNVHLHFTVSPEHDALFAQKVREKVAYYEQIHGVRYQISFSNQKAATDTIAVDLENRPFRNDDGSLLFRPAGHGALIENLDDIYADIVFIKNIDNVVPDHLKAETYRYKKALAGVLLEVQNKVFGYLAQLEESVSAPQIAEISKFVRETLSVELPEDFAEQEATTRVTWLKKRLYRPLRVCGMVKNEGEPGGGPFWVQGSDGITNLQIVESAQIDADDAAQMQLAKAATHFNPVDLVCAVRDHQEAKYDLLKYRDPKTGFITQKSKDGKELKAQELPGLWNGAMAYWNTVFVEVPVITFNPVKTVNDLLRPQHQ